jgi:hypothetical protein
MPIVDEKRKHPYSDTPAPKRFGWVSPFDPALFSRMDDFAGELLESKPSGRYSPVEVAVWLDDLAGKAAASLAEAEAKAPASVELRRLAIDVAMEGGIGRFFAAKFRAGVLYAIYERTGDRAALEEALKAYKKARAAWAEVAERGKVYRDDISFGYVKHLRGHWLDRLPAIDGDIADMEKRLAQAKPGDRARAAVRAVLAPQARPAGGCKHTAPRSFRHGEPLAIELAVARPVEARLRYRHVNQSEIYQVAEMRGKGTVRAVIPGEYTQAPYAMEYFFELHHGGEAWLYPGFAPDLSNQPYFVVSGSAG